MTLHLEELNSNIHFCDQLAKLSKSFCNDSLSDSVPILHHNLVTSANIFILFTIHLGKSFTNKRIKVVPVRSPGELHCNDSLSDSVPILHHNLVTSANIFILFTIHLGKPFTNKRIKAVPVRSTEPWGTPLMTSISSENVPLIPSFIFLDMRNDSIHFRKHPVIPYVFNFSISLLCGTLSNAIL